MSRGSTPGDSNDPRYALAPNTARKTRAEGDILVLPERAIRLGGSGAEILALCEAGYSRREIQSGMEHAYPGTEPGLIGEEVDRFIAEMQALGGLREIDAEAEATRPAAQSLETRAAAGQTKQQAKASPSESIPTPLNLIAELTYRCPLQCPYCSNPLQFGDIRDRLSAEDWGRVFEEAAALGVVHVGLTGGEPSARADLEQILERAIAADLYPHLVTAGLPLTPERLEGLAQRGLRSVQVSIQDASAAGSDRIAGTKSFEQKRAICERTVELGLALTLNTVLHRDNLASVPALITLAEEWQADRLELANTQYHGWALLNRAALMPSREQLAEGSRAVEEAQQRHAQASGGPKMLFVMPDYYSDRPKPCMGGWGRLAMVIDPAGRVLPCHEAGELPGLDFWRVPERSVSECWRDAPGMNRYRGTDWMPEPCQSCPDRERDFAGCRCQAFRLLGDASQTDPACSLSPDHDVIIRARGEEPLPFVPRRTGRRTPRA